MLSTFAVVCSLIQSETHFSASLKCYFCHYWYVLPPSTKKNTSSFNHEIIYITITNLVSSLPHYWLLNNFKTFLKHIHISLLKPVITDWLNQEQITLTEMIIKCPVLPSLLLPCVYFSVLCLLRSNNYIKSLVILFPSTYSICGSHLNRLQKCSHEDSKSFKPRKEWENGCVW